MDNLNLPCISRNQRRRCEETLLVPSAQARDTKANAALSSSANSIDRERNSTQLPIEQLPEPEGDWSLPFIGETPEFKTNHWEWARKRQDTALTTPAYPSLACSAGMCLRHFLHACKVTCPDAPACLILTCKYVPSWLLAEDHLHAQWHTVLTASEQSSGD